MGVRRLPWQHDDMLPSNEGDAWRDDQESTPAAHASWGPEYWPAEVRENVTAWPPPFRERQLTEAVRIPLDAPVVIAVMGRKKNIGKSTLSRLLDTVFRAHRDDESVVLDAHGEGTETPRYVAAEKTPREALRAGDHMSVMPFVHRDERTGVSAVVERIQGARLRRVSPPEDDLEYGNLIDLLAQHYRIIICDISEDLPAEAVREILSRTSAVLVVSTTSLDGVYAASSTLSWIAEQGYEELARSAVVCVNQIRSIPFTALVTISRYFKRDPRTVIRLPWDRRLDTTADPVDMDELLPTTRTGAYELAGELLSRRAALTLPANYP